MRSLLALSLLLVAAAARPASGDSWIAIPTNATWRLWQGTREASTPDATAWRQRTHPDGAWIVAAAPFYYGEPFSGGTQLGDMQNNYTTVFLRRTFVLTNAAAVRALTLTAACDDGFLAWINGVEVARVRAPAGEPAYTSLASANAPEPVRFEAAEASVARAALVTGTNVLAVQGFNVNLTSSDFVFDAALSVEEDVDTPPIVSAVTPPPGEVQTLTQITVVFSVPVTGVDANDLLISDEPARSVSGRGTTYTFDVAQPSYGLVQVAWLPNCGIAVASDPTRVFNPTAPESRWMYELVDPLGPRVASLFPPPELRVRRLEHLEVTFDKEVQGVDAGDLLANGQPAVAVTGQGAGPYLLRLPPLAAGPVDFRWRDGHGIVDTASTPHGFGGGAWRCVLDPTQPRSPVRITEFLAENATGYLDEDGEAEDWIELFNQGSEPANLRGLALTDNASEPGKWALPDLTLGAGRYLVIHASGKDRRPTTPGGRLHTNFKLRLNGEYLGLYSADAPREALTELRPGFPAQRVDYSYGVDPSGQWRYFQPPTPGGAASPSTITGLVANVHFSVERGFFVAPFNLTLATATPGATIRYTLDGSAPTATLGQVYNAPIPINATRLVRAAAFMPDHLPAPVRTHTYLFNLPATRRLLPALSLVTASNHLYGTTGIMEYNPRNTTKHGIAWERPVSAELIRPEDNGGFQVDCGLRVQGGGYIRGLYNYRSSPPQGKYSFRLYFRGDYGEGRLRYPWFPDTTVDSFDVVVLRAGMNDHTNPFILDEYVRALASDVGQPACHGTFVNLFLNGVYKGYYNPCERLDGDFLETYHGGSQAWDVIAQSSELREGDLAAWNALRNYANRDLTVRANYEAVAALLDLTNFVDYLLPNIYVDADDWPHNNWRAARPRVAGGPFRFYVWDAEWSFGYMNNHAPSFNTIGNQLSTLSPPWGGTEIQRIFNGLKRSPEFRLLFADRVHRHLFNGGALTDERLRARWDQLKRRLNGTISGFNDRVSTTWIPQRRRYVTNHLATAGFLASSNAPAFNRHGGPVPRDFLLTLNWLTGSTYYTTDGSDPRVAFTDAVAPSATLYRGPFALTRDTWIKARTLSASTWSALAEAVFRVADLGSPLRFTEIMYNPPGGDAYEYLELMNTGTTDLDVGGVSLGGVEFRFPPGTLLRAGQRAVLASEFNPPAFAARYPALTVAGHFKGALANGGERLTLIDANGRTLSAVDYDDEGLWPAAADGAGYALEIVDPLADPDDPANWQASAEVGGSPGLPNAPLPSPSVQLHEVSAATDGPNGGGDWIELFNAGAASATLAGWSLTDDANLRKFVFPAGATLASGAYLRVWCDALSVPAGYHTGFALSRDGEQVGLFDAQTNRIDAVTFGPQVSGYTLGRIGAGRGSWQLCEPTPGGPNEPAVTAALTHLAINEFLANPLPGESDWLEVHNLDATRPLALRGTFAVTSNALFQVTAHVFVPPAGFVRLWADEQPGPQHLDLRLPAAGGMIAWHDTNGTELSRLTYGLQTEGVSAGRLPDGTGPLTSFPGSASPGAANYLAAYDGVRLNECLAFSDVATDAGGRVADWIELYNPQATNVPLAGMSVSVGEPKPGQWAFPPGATLAAGAYLRLWCDGSEDASISGAPPWNLGRSLANRGGGVYLFDATGRLVEQLEYGFQLPDQSIGRAGERWTLLSVPTPGATNSAPAALGAATAVRLNEWYASTNETDWLELYNLDPLPVALAGLTLTDDPSLAGRTNHVIRPLTFIGGQAWVLWMADGDPTQGPDHLPFRVDRLGETLRLYAPDFTIIDTLDLGLQPPVGSQGRLPDGGATLVAFADTPTPGESNYLLLTNVVVNEVLAHTDPPLEDAIELFNPSSAAVDLGGWYLSNKRSELKRFRIADGTILAAGGFRVFYEAQFNPTPGQAPSFTLNSAHGDEVYLSATDAAGNLTGHRAQVRFGATENARSLGRVPISTGFDFAPLERRTFGVDTPASLADFRLGRGLPNAPAQVGPIVLHELMYHPVAPGGTNAFEPPDEEFVELYNLAAGPVPFYDTEAPANRWKLAAGIEFTFPTGFTLPAGGFVLVVPFDPWTNSAALATFKARYQPPPATPILGPYRGQLSNRGESVELLRPDRPQTAPHPDAGFVPYVRVDRVTYGDVAPWPAAADGTGASLQRLRPTDYGNDPAHWKASAPTAGRANVEAASDRDGDGLPDAWEQAQGLDPDSALGANGAAGDPDEDGLTNLDEYRAGTHPRQPTPWFRSVALGTEGLRLRFRVGTGRTYVLESRATLGAGGWAEVRRFTPVGAAEDFEFTTAVAAGSAERYFRLVWVP